MPVVHVAMGCGQKNFKLVWPPAPVRLPSQWPLAPNVTSVTSVANDKDDNEMIPGLCSDLLAFSLQLRKTSARRPSMNTATSYRLKCLPFPPNEVGRITQHVRRGEGSKEGKGGCDKWILH